MTLEDDKLVRESCERFMIAEVRKDHPDLFAMRFIYVNGIMKGYDWRPRGGWGPPAWYGFLKTEDLTDCVQTDTHYYNLDK